MSELAGHTIHKDHIHHGWNNAFAPCLTISPGAILRQGAKALFQP